MNKTVTLGYRVDSFLELHPLTSYIHGEYYKQDMARSNITIQGITIDSDSLTSKDIEVTTSSSKTPLFVSEDMSIYEGGEFNTDTFRIAFKTDNFFTLSNIAFKSNTQSKGI